MAKTKTKARKNTKPSARKAKKPKGLRARRASPSLKLKAGKSRATARKVYKGGAKSARRGVAAFRGGVTSAVAKGYQAIREFLSKPRTIDDKRAALARIGIKPYKKKTLNRKQQNRVKKIYAEFSEFAGTRQRFKIIRGASKAIRTKAEKSGMAVYDKSIYVHLSKKEKDGTAKLGKFMGEDIVARTYYGKKERIFLGGADTFNRVSKKLAGKKLKPGQYITGSFFGGPTFHRRVLSIEEFLNYINNQFVPHMNAGQKATKRNIARARRDLIRNLAIVEVKHAPTIADADDNDETES